ncbi:MAG: 2-C-methyl-D-erythritol 4-phosphate cytidylyltransferase [Gammaproteobacteria bacterium]|nr:2-C-methyl-D-erythritol 4-phosphate cytidylyltransferase [Gammaproteobacteria bacterium]MCY4226805.1 2-C-methyl-D-erythritol 4-phosphate cytidylyltransferase [Gammaproteobacteria bacterium]
MTKQSGNDLISREVWAIVPAAGQGVRMGGALPKQHMDLCGKSMLHLTLSRLCEMPFITGVIVGLAVPDPRWENDPYEHPKFHGEFGGGERRQDTVREGVLHLVDAVGVDLGEYVLVHDAARPCITHEDALKVVMTALQHEDGAVLGSRVKDTIKSSNEDGVISGTLDRNSCWRAYTPQVFKAASLLDALDRVLDSKVTVTDEAMAMEYAGRSPIMVQGSDMNIKVTEQTDLRLAEAFLEGGASS